MHPRFGQAPIRPRASAAESPSTGTAACFCYSHTLPTNRVKIFWVIVTFDTAGEVIFTTASRVKHQVFNGLLLMNGASFRLRQQDHFW